MDWSWVFIFWNNLNTFFKNVKIEHYVLFALHYEGFFQNLLRDCFITQRQMGPS